MKNILSIILLFVVSISFGQKPENLVPPVDADGTPLCQNAFVYYSGSPNSVGVWAVKECDGDGNTTIKDCKSGATLAVVPFCGPAETVTTFTANSDGTVTYVSEDGTSTTSKILTCLSTVGPPELIRQSNSTLSDGTTVDITGGNSLSFSSNNQGDVRWEGTITITTSKPSKLILSPTTTGDPVVLNPLTWTYRNGTGPNNPSSTRLTTDGDDIEVIAGSTGIIIADGKIARSGQSDSSGLTASDDWGTVIANNGTVFTLRARQTDAVNIQIQPLDEVEICDITNDLSQRVDVLEGFTETVTTLVDNGDGSFSYTNEDGVTVTYSDADTQNTVSSTTGNVEVIETTNPDGTTNYDLDVCKVTDFKLNATGDSLIIDVLNPDGSITGLTTVIPQGGDEDDNDGIGGDFYIDVDEIVDIDSVLIDGIWYVTENRIDKDELLDGCLPPVAVKDCETTPVNTTVILDICTNDYPLDGDIVEYVFKGTFTQGGSYTFDPVTCEFIYDPLNDYVGKDSLEYCVVDMEGDTSNSTYVIIDIIFVPSASNLISNSREDDGADNFILETLAGSEDCDGNSPVTNCVDVTYNLGHLPDPNHDGGSNFATGKYLILEGNSCDPFPSGITKLEGSDGTQYALPADVATIADIYDWDFTNAGGTIGTITGVAKAQTTCEQINKICGDLLAVSYFVDDCATSNVSTDTIRWEWTDREHYMSSARLEAGGSAPFGRAISNKNGERYCNANGNFQSRTNTASWDSDQRHTYYHGTYNNDGPGSGTGSLDPTLPMILVDADDPVGAQIISLGLAPSNHVENQYYYSFSHNSELVPSTAGQLWSFNGTWAIDIGDQNGNNTKSLSNSFLSQTFNDNTGFYAIISAINPNNFEFANTFTRTTRVYEGCGQFGVNEVADPIDASRPTIMRPDLSGFVEITSLFSPQSNFTRTSLDNMQKYCGQCITIQGITEITFTEGPYTGETFIIENVEQTVITEYR